jgi:hypothetical protein
MKLEFLPDGSPDCPLIRLYSFVHPEVLRLREIANKLATGEMREIALHDEAGLEPINSCQLSLRLGKRDQCIVQNGPQSFDCILPEEGWLDMSSLLEPFCENPATGFQWLVDKGPISLLISNNGTW